MTDAEYETKHPSYSLGYEDACAGKIRLHSRSWTNVQIMEYDIGYDRAATRKVEVERANEGDPSSEYLSRVTMQQSKWR